MSQSSNQSPNDWAAGSRALMLVWGLPIAAMVLAMWAEPILKTLIWLAALIWMGGACLLNARRCGRVHCRYTGPLFLLMTIPVALHGFAIVPFGPDGWRWLGLAIGLGNGAVWYFSEKIWGRYHAA